MDCGTPAERRQRLGRLSCYTRYRLYSSLTKWLLRHTSSVFAIQFFLYSTAHCCYTIFQDIQYSLVAGAITHDYGRGRQQQGRGWQDNSYFGARLYALPRTAHGSRWWTWTRKSLWWSGGSGAAKADNPTIFEGAVTAGDAVEALTLDGWDYCFLDGPPAFLTLLQEMIEAADFTLIPVKASMVDLLATQDAVSLARDAHATFMCVFNDVGSSERVAEKARELLLNAEVPIAKAEVVHRISHVQAMTVGKSAAEVNSGKDSAASAEIDALWKEVKEAATKAARAKARKKAAAHG